jgi:hypothetical protein
MTAHLQNHVLRCSSVPVLDGPSWSEDFLSWFVRGTDLIAVEAKSGQTFTDTCCKGLRAVAQPKGLCRRIIVYPRGPVLRTEDGIDVFPFQHFATVIGQRLKATSKNLNFES